MSTSLLDKVWKNATTSENDQQVQSLAHELGISTLFSKVLISRGFTNSTQASSYLYPSEKQCHDPFLMKDMNLAVERLHHALTCGKRIVIYGDYDVDGTVSTAILYRYLKKAGARVYYFIPDRIKHGYGLTAETIKLLQKQDTDLVITVDNGSTAVAESKLLSQAGIELIITDHHQLSVESPECSAFLNPQQPSCNYPFKGLCGAGVVYKLTEALTVHLDQKNYWKALGYTRPTPQKMLGLVAFATIADRVPLADENRYFVKVGLEQLNQEPILGLQALCKESRVRGTITPSTINFKIAPKINAAGRLDNAGLAVKLMLSRSWGEAKELARQLVSINSKRQTIEQHALKKAYSQAAEQQDQNAILLVDSHWHPGIMGNLAAKVAGSFQKPTLVLTLFQGNTAVGSGRSFGNFNLHAVLDHCSGFLERFGGHYAAVGLSLSAENIEPFRESFLASVNNPRLQQRYHSKEPLKIDAWATPKELTKERLSELKLMMPFGMGNHEPIIGLKDARLKSAKILSDRHLKMYLQCTQSDIEVMAWERSDWYPNLPSELDLAVSPQLNTPANAEGPLRHFRAWDVRLKKT